MHTANVNKQLDIELSLQALTIELSNLLSLEHKLEDADKQILRDCSIKINQLILRKVA